MGGGEKAVSDQDDINYNFSSSLAQSLIDGFKNDNRPATKSDIAHLLACQLMLYDYCFAIFALSSFVSDERRQQARTGAMKAGNDFSDMLGTAVKNIERSKAE